VLALIAAAGLSFWQKLLRKRRELDGLVRYCQPPTPILPHPANGPQYKPQPPMGQAIFGHLQHAGELRKLYPPGTHPHAWGTYLRKKYNLGDVFYVDWWPLGPRNLFIADPELASQYVTTGQSLPKSPAVADFLNRFLGVTNMVTLEGQEWKTLRSIFNPGFSAAHLMTLVPYIIDTSLIFCDLMREKARSNELFMLEESTTRLTIDIIGKIVLDADLNSQKRMHPIVDTFRKRITLLPIKTGILPWEDFDLFRPVKLWLNARRLDHLVGLELDRKLEARKAEENSDTKPDEKQTKTRKRAVIDLALDAYHKEISTSGTDKERAAMLSGQGSQAFRRKAIDSFKTFIFAGHDTTSSTICYVLYLLHLDKRAHEKMVDEINDVFGGKDCDTASIAEAMKQDHYIVNKLEYMTAVIKETLRLFPPASTLRFLPEESDPSKIQYFTDPKSGRSYPLSGWQIWPASILIGRNEAFFPEPAAFIPERFIASQTPFPDAKLFTPAGKDAWRPFEKGPRNCIGQELAMIETKVILALIVKEFDFVAEYDGVRLDSWAPIETIDEYADGKPGSERMTLEGHRCFQVLKGAAKPAGAMPGRIYLR